MKTLNIGVASVIGATAFLCNAQAANVIVNSNFDNDSGSAIVGTNGTRNISGWGNIHLYNHNYNGTEGPKLSEVGDLNYGANDDITLGDNALTDTYKGLGNASQTVDLSTTLAASVITAIDTGTAQLAFSAWMASWSGDNNTVATQLDFFASTDGSGIALQTFTLDRGNTINQINTARDIVNVDPFTAESDPDFWALYEIESTVPTTARSLTVSFVAGTGHIGGGSNDWYTDQVVVDIIGPAAVPEPTSTALLSLAGGLSLLRRRRK